MAEVALADMGFNYPIILSTYYTGCNWAGASVFHRETAANPPCFNRRQWMLVSVLSLCTALNTLIGRKNISIPTTFDQVVQSLGPAIVMLLVTQIFNRSVSRERKIATVPIGIGVAMAWYADMEVSTAAFMISGSCLVLNAMKLVIWSEMLTGDFKVTPLHLLSRVSPMTFVQVGMYAYFRGEPAAMLEHWKEILAGWALYFIVVTGVISFVLTVVNMHATTFATPLTVSVLGALKQVGVIVFKVWRGGRPISRMNVLGMVIVAAGAAKYAVVSRAERKQGEKAGADIGSATKKGGGRSGSAAPLLPTTASAAPNTLANGKGPRKALISGKGTSKTLLARAKAWSAFWGGGKDQDSLRIR